MTNKNPTGTEHDKSTKPQWGDMQDLTVNLPNMPPLPGPRLDVEIGA